MDVLVCTHGRRDACCGGRGTELVRALAETTPAAPAPGLHAWTRRRAEVRAVAHQPHRWPPLCPHGAGPALRHPVGVGRRGPARPGRRGDRAGQRRREPLPGLRHAGAPAHQAVEKGVLAEVGWPLLSSWRRASGLGDGWVRLATEVAGTWEGGWPRAATCPNPNAGRRRSWPPSKASSGSWTSSARCRPEPRRAVPARWAPQAVPSYARSRAQGSGRQPGRDRDQGLSGHQRARFHVGGRLSLRGPLLAPSPEGGRELRDRRARAPAAGLPGHRRHHRGGPGLRRRRHLPGLRLPVREPGPGPGLRRRRHHLRRPPGRGPGAGREQGEGEGGGRGRRDPGAAQRRAPCRRSTSWSVRPGRSASRCS